MKLLIVDDDLRRANKIKDEIESSVNASIVTVVGSYGEAKNILHKHHFDMMILDILLPQRSGYSLPSEPLGIRLIDELHRRTTLNTPAKIIGITANKKDISNYQSTFNKYLFLVVETTYENNDWLFKIVDAVNYQYVSSKGINTVNLKKICVTIHGIRTFGGWQKKLEEGVREVRRDVIFRHYQFGIFTIPMFFLPYVKELRVRRFASKLKTFIANSKDSEIYFFSHSFGTYVLANAINRLIAEGVNVPAKYIILSGSVVEASFNWNLILNSTNAIIINDCGNSDYVLWMSEAFIPKSGMIGKTGILGILDDRIINRYFDGGHGLYFDGNDFVKDNWIPLFEDDQSEIKKSDTRKQSIFEHEIIERVVICLGKIKSSVYIISAFILIVFLAT